MTLHLYAAFVAATTLLILIPGPNVALIVANSLAYGPRCGLLTVAGTSSAMVAQLALAVLGMTTLLDSLADGFQWLRWIGVAYLVALAVRSWRAPAQDLTRVGAVRGSGRMIFLRGFLVSSTNPKTLLFYGAFLPQFVTPGAGLIGQFGLLATTFLVIAVVLDSLWALSAARFGGVLAVDSKLRNRVTAVVLAGAGAGLALARKS